MTTATPRIHQRRRHVGEQCGDGADGGQLGGQEDGHVGHGNEGDPAPHPGAIAGLGELADAAPPGQVASDGGAIEPQYQERQRRADGVAGQRHRSHEGPDLRRGEEDPGAHAGGQERQADGLGALGVAGGHVVIEGAVGPTGTQAQKGKAQ
ncbi:hypothetical protein Q427_02220 [Halomonas sp. BC04]|nr:hypothetical protein Q427_02220 [Halomonas sp. BC04]